jgi:hypothetical protein
MALVEQTIRRISTSKRRNGTISAQALVHSRTMAGYLRSHFGGEFGERVQGGLLGWDGVDRLEPGGDQAPVGLGRVAQAGADQVDDAGLHHRGRPHLADGVGQAFQAVADHHAHVAGAAILDLGQDA